MRFRFCGDLDAPDWLLVDIDLLSKLVSKISFFRRRETPSPDPTCVFLTQTAKQSDVLCSQVVEELLSRKTIDFQKARDKTLTTLLYARAV